MDGGDENGRRLAGERWIGDVGRTVRTAGLTLSEVIHRRERRIGLHRHERAFFCLLVAGTYAETSARGTASYAAGTLLFQPPGLAHADAIGPGGALFFTVELGPGPLLGLLGGGRLPRRTIEARSGELPRLAAALRRTAMRAPALRAAAAVESLAAELLERIAAPPGPPEGRAPAWLDRAEESIRTRFRDGLTVTDLAREAGVHPYHLARVFRRHRGIGPVAFLHELRVGWAWERLRDPAARAAEVAREAGFVDPSHMIKVFRKLTGRTPGDLRQAGRMT